MYKVVIVSSNLLKYFSTSENVSFNLLNRFLTG